MSLTGSKPTSTKEAPQNQPQEVAKQEQEAEKQGHPGFGANKKFPYIDE